MYFQCNGSYITLNIRGCKILGPDPKMGRESLNGSRSHGRFQWVAGCLHGSRHVLARGELNKWSSFLVSEFVDILSENSRTRKTAVHKISLLHSLPSPSVCTCRYVVACLCSGSCSGRCLICRTVILVASGKSYKPRVWI